MAATYFVAKSVIIDEEGSFLLLTRSDTHPTLAGMYDLPGGMIEAGEEPGAGVRREILEETGIVTDNADVLYATTMMIGGASYPTLLYVVRVLGSSPEVTLSWEHGTFEWAPIEKLSLVEPQLAPTYGEAFNYIRANDILRDILA